MTCCERVQVLLDELKKDYVGDTHMPHDICEAMTAMLCEWIWDTYISDDQISPAFKEAKAWLESVRDG